MSQKRSGGIRVCAQTLGGGTSLELILTAFTSRFESSPTGLIQGGLHRMVRALSPACLLPQTCSQRERRGMLTVTNGEKGHQIAWGPLGHCMLLPLCRGCRFAKLHDKVARGLEL